MRAAILFFVLAPVLAAQQKQPVTLDVLEELSRANPSGPGSPLAWSPDGGQFVYRDGSRLMIYDAARQSSRRLLDTGPLDDQAVTPNAGDPSQPFDWQNRRVSEARVQWSANGDDILYAAGGDLFLIDVQDRDWRQLTRTAAAERDPKLSPDGNSVAFRRDWDLYVLDLASGKDRRLTTGGSADLRNGGLDWVYPEELDLGTAYWWSPDSHSIAYLQFDVLTEPLHPQADLVAPRAIYEPEPYPHPGDDNPAVRLGLVPAEGGPTRWLDVGDTRTHYLVARVSWTPDSRQLYVVRPNRVQNRQDLLAFDVASGEVSTVLEESDPYWINVGAEPVFIDQGREFLWLSERDGFQHIYRYSRDGSHVAQLTHGDWMVTSIDGVRGTGPRTRVYYTSTEESPLERHIYSMDLDGGDRQRLSTRPGTHSLTVGPDARFYLHTFSSTTDPPETTLHSGDGTQLAVYRPADRSIAERYQLLPSEFLSYKGSDGTLFHARLIRPAGFTEGERYPVIVSAYGGPGAQSVRDVWAGADMDQVLAQAGFVIWQLDNRGSAGRGHAFETPVFHRLGELELADQVAGVEYLVSLGFADPERIGVQGWSYGGFMTLNALLNAPDVFRAGVAGAPVTGWRNYDTIYTERYMGLPSDNEDGYETTALPQHAAKLEGALMLMHNLEDDNVLFQNTAQMIDALERAGKQFELVLYTQKSHSLSGEALRHRNAAMLDFFERHLSR